MSDPSMPPAAPPAPEPPARPRTRPWSIGEIASWAVIVVAVATMVTAVVLLRRADARDQRNDQATAQLLLSARYAIGLNEGMKMLKQAGGRDQRMAVDQLVSELENNAKTPEDRLRAAILRGDLLEPDAIQTPEDRLRSTVAGGDPHVPDHPLSPLDQLETTEPSLQRDVAIVRQLYAGDPVPADQWKLFRERYGWFADLAASRGKPATDPSRAAIVSASLRTMFGLIIIVLAALAGGLIGLLLFILAAVLYFKGRLVPRFDRAFPLPADRRAYVEGFALFLCCLVGGSLLLRTLSSEEVIDPSAASILGMVSLLVAFLAGILWPIFRGQSFRDWRAVLGLHAPRGILREVLSGIMGYVAGIPLLIAGAIISMILIRISGADASHPITQQLDKGPAVWAIVFLLASVWAPISEELLFRGMLLAHLRERFPWWFSAVVVALVFALIHPQGWAAVPVLGALAVVFAGIREWRGSTLGCIAAHGLHNGAALLIATMILT